MNKLLIAGGILLLANGAGVAHAGPAAAGAKGLGAGRSAGAIPGPTSRPVVGHFGGSFGFAPLDRHRGKQHDRRHRHRDHSRYYPIWGHYGDGDGYVETEVTPDMFGFFATGGEVDLVGGEAVYDYDRGYPYDWYRDESRMDAQSAATAAPRILRCEVSWVPADSGKERIPVRICRR